jgi:hypothetical protein
MLGGTIYFNKRPGFNRKATRGLVRVVAFLFDICFFVERPIV